MAVEPILLLLLAAVVGNSVLMAVIVVPPFLGRGDAFLGESHGDVQMSPIPADASAVTGGRPLDVHDDGVPLAAYDRVVRIVALSWSC